MKAKRSFFFEKLHTDYIPKHIAMEQIREKTQPSQPNLRLYLEVADHFENGQAVFQAPPSSRSPTILVFIKLFDAATQSVQ